MRVAKGALILAVASCTSPQDSGGLCDVAQRPGEFIGREISISDILIVDGHGDPRFVPSSSCPRFLWFPVQVHELKPAAREQFISRMRGLINTTVDGNRAGIAGTYRVRVLGERTGEVDLSLLDVTDMRLADAADKSRSIEKEMPPPPPDPR